MEKNRNNYLLLTPMEICLFIITWNLGQREMWKGNKERKRGRETAKNDY